LGKAAQWLLVFAERPIGKPVHFGTANAQEVAIFEEIHRPYVIANIKEVTICAKVSQARLC
jgi:hypothetical protein